PVTALDCWQDGLARRRSAATENDRDAILGEQPVCELAIGFRIRPRIVSDHLDIAAADSAALVDFLDCERGAEEVLGLRNLHHARPGKQNPNPPSLGAGP